MNIHLIEVGETVGIPVRESQIRQVLPDGVRFILRDGVAFYALSDVVAYHRRNRRHQLANEFEVARDAMLAREVSQ